MDMSILKIILIGILCLAPEKGRLGKNKRG